MTSSKNVKVFLGLGSNIERERHVHAGLDALADYFGELRISSVYESRAVGFDGNNFFNLVVGVDTDQPVQTLSDVLKRIEDDNGRLRQGPKFSPRTLDIDILTYGNFVGNGGGIELPRAEILKNAFVLQPLAEIAPDEQHPQLRQTYAALWRAYDKNSQALWPVNFIWRGRWISKVADQV